MYAIYDKHGIWQDSAQSVPAAFLDFHQELLGTRCDSRRQVVQQIVHSGPLLIDEHRAMLEWPYSAVPDGFGAHFYKDTMGYRGSRYH